MTGYPTRTADVLHEGMVILWGLGDQRPTPHTITSITFRPGQGYGASLRPEGSPYTTGVMLYPHLSYPVLSVPHSVLAEEALNDWKTSYWDTGELYCADHPGEPIDSRYGCSGCHARGDAA